VRQGASDHLHSLLQFEVENIKPLAPFKFNYPRLTEEEFKALVFRNWKHVDSNLDDSIMKQFADNLKRVKGDVVEWTKVYAQKRQDQLKEVEEGIKSLFNNNEAGVFSEEEFNSLKEIEKSKKVLPDKEETAWRLKSRAIWLSKGNRNTKEFHKFISHTQNVSSFKEIAETGKMHFKHLCSLKVQLNLGKL
jgi:hypothetical protein